MKRIEEFAEDVAILSKYDYSGFGIDCSHDFLRCAVSSTPSEEE